MRNVGALVFPGFELLDLFGPLEMLGLLKDDFNLKLVSEVSGQIPSNQQVSAYPDMVFAEVRSFDLLLIPGGFGTRREVGNPVMLDWINGAVENTEYVLSVCTGSRLLAAAGVLDGKRATTNKMAFDTVAEAYPNVEWVRQARWVEDGKFFTSSGVSAGMDMTLGFIERLHGLETAEQVATWAEYDWHKDRNSDPFAKIHGLG